jgi:MFS family permease
LKSSPPTASYLSLAVLWGIFFVGFSVRMAVIITMPLIREDLHISYAEAGMLLSLLSISYGLIQFPSGILSDTYNNKRLLLVVTLSLVPAMVAVSVSQELLSLAVSLFCTGLFVGFSTPTSFSLLSKTFPTRTGTLLGIYNTAPSIAQFLGTYISGVLATAYDWHWVYYVWILLEVGLVALVWSCIPSTDAPSTASAPINVASVKEVFSDRTLLCFLLPFVAHSVCAFSALTMNPLFMVEVYRLDVTQTATVYGVTRFFGLFGSFIGGVLSDRFAKIKLLLASLVITALCMYAFATLPYGFWTIGLLTVQAVSINLFFPTIYALLVGLTSSSTRGKAQGLYNSVAFTVGGVAPYIMGVITDVSSFQQAFMFPLLIAVIGILWLSILLLKGSSPQAG